jgi:hypothetical protein
MEWWTRRIFALVATALTMVAGASAATGLGTMQAQVEPLVCPAYDAGKVQNPLPLAPAGETPVGGTSGQFTVGGDGAARYSIPLQAVPGPGGMTPALSLDYSSRTGNGYVGVGFSLAGPTVISRCSKTIAEDGVTEGVRLDAADRFCLAGLRLVAVSGTYGADGTEYRTSPETFARVTSVRTSPGSLDDGPDYFEVRTKDGLIHTYGLSDNDVIGPRRVSWPITEMRDRQGNRIKFVYGTIKAPSSDPSLPGNVVIARWLDEMHYGNFTALIGGVPSPDRKVKFSYDSRPDAFHGYALGEVRSVSTRLSKIEMHRLVGAPGHGGYANARSYTLTYQNDGATGFSKLRSLQECGTSSSACLPATTFDWEPGAAGFEARKVQQISVVPLPPSSVIVSSLLVLDVDGNGMEDLAFPHDTASGSGGEVWQILPSSGGSPFIDHNVFTAPLEGLSGAGTEAFAIDYDLDGRTDILPRDTFANDNKAWRPLLSRGGGTTARFMAPINTGFVGPVNQKDRFATFADLDGDGYQDTLEYHE